MKKNDLFTLTAESLGADLEGICRLDGIPIFVPGLLPGETTDVRIVKAEKRYAFGRMESFPSVPSSSRRGIDCAAYPRCGGCTGRHMDYASTLEAKRQQVADCFQRIGNLKVSVPSLLGAASPFGYRNKTALPVGGTVDAPYLGFYAPRSHTIIPISSCPNAKGPANEIASVFLSWMKKYRIEPYNEEKRTGLIRHLVIRVNRAGESMVCIVATKDRLPHSSELISTLQSLNVISLWLNQNPAATNVIFSDRYDLLYGSNFLTERLFDLEFELSPASFFQVNADQTEVLYQTAIDMAQLHPSDLLCDVYCGVGSITLSMARACREAIGIEIVPAAIENARRNAKRNHIQNTTFFTGAAEDLLPKLVSDGLKPDVIVVDPPRKGLDQKVIRAISQAQPDRLVYISCNPATLARDAALLHQEGYSIQCVQPVDMFCWTSGIETVVQFSQ